MMKFFVLCFFAVSIAEAYVPTVESLFRHGGNPEVSANGISVTLNVKRLQVGAKSSGVQDVALLKEQKAEDFFKLFFTKSSNDVFKIAQTRYSNNSFSESSLEHKIYNPNFTAYTMKGNEKAEKGVFFSLMHSLILNDGAHFVNYLKTLGVPVKLNNEIINREKVTLLADYKKYLATINKDRSAKKNIENPLKPEDASSRERAEKIFDESMYVDTNQVKLSREEGQMAWLINAGTFEAVVSYKEREIQKVKLKTELGEFEVICKDYWLANGTHSMPRYMMIKDFKGETYQVEVTNLRHYVEKEEDLVKRLHKWDQILKGKESSDPRPEFLL